MIDEFLEYLKLERNYSPKTVGSYGDDLCKFQSFCKKLDSNITWATVDADIVRDWMEQMMDAGNSASSVNRRLSALRSFYRFALRRGLVSHDPVHRVQGPKKKKPLPHFVKESEMDRLLDSRMWTSSYRDTLARTILIVFYETGVRLSELIGMDDASVDFAQSQIKVTGKRNKQRIIPFGQEMHDALKAYMQQRDKDVTRLTDGLFLTAKGKRVTKDQVEKMVREKLGLVTTMKKRSPHVLRHSFATAMLNHDAGIESVRKLLGHESLSTTEIYTHTTFEQLKKVYKNAHPRA